MPKHMMYTVCMTSFPLRDARDQLGQIVDSVRGTQEPAIITRYGQPAAVIVDIDEWRHLEALRDAADAAYIRDRVAAQEPSVPLDEVVAAYDAAAGVA